MGLYEYDMKHGGGYMGLNVHGMCTFICNSGQQEKWATCAMCE